MGNIQLQERCTCKLSSLLELVYIHWTGMVEQLNQQNHRRFHVCYIICSLLCACTYVVLQTCILQAAPPPLPYQDKQTASKFTTIHGKCTTHQTALHYLHMQLLHSQNNEHSRMQERQAAQCTSEEMINHYADIVISPIYSTIPFHSSIPVIVDYTASGSLVCRHFHQLFIVLHRSLGCIRMINGHTCTCTRLSTQ